MRAGAAVADSAAGLCAATGILVALAERERSGRGQRIATSLPEAQIALMDFQAARYRIEGEVPPQAGNDHPCATPMGAIATRDGWLDLGVGADGQWQALCRALDRPDWAEDAAHANERVVFGRPTAPIKGSSSPSRRPMR